jgi:hypothetical protein
VNRAKLTQSIYDQLPASQRDQVTLAAANELWWQDLRDDGGLRLSQHGYHVFEELKIEKYVFSVAANTPASPAQLIALSRHVTCPYFLRMGKTPSITLFGSREATMYALYGDIKRFVQAISR